LSARLSLMILSLEVCFIITIKRNHAHRKRRLSFSFYFSASENLRREGVGVGVYGASLPSEFFGKGGNVTLAFYMFPTSFSLEARSFSGISMIGSRCGSDGRLVKLKTAGAIQGWSFSSCMVILVFGLTSRQRLRTERHSRLSSAAIEGGSLYFPALMASMVTAGVLPLKGSYPTSMP
jgi:hypothetical protein